ncbi:hypothetical protein E2320_009504, partial [Naja naja]
YEQDQTWVSTEHNHIPAFYLNYSELNLRSI